MHKYIFKLCTLLLLLACPVLAADDINTTLSVDLSIYPKVSSLSSLAVILFK